MSGERSLCVPEFTVVVFQRQAVGQGTLCPWLRSARDPARDYMALGSTHAVMVRAINFLAG